jgi:hypothetical protein
MIFSNHKDISVSSKVKHNRCLAWNIYLFLNFRCMPTYINIGRIEFYKHQRCIVRYTSLLGAGLSQFLKKSKSNYSLTNPATKTVRMLCSCLNQEHSLISYLCNYPSCTLLFCARMRSRACVAGTAPAACACGRASAANFPCEALSFLIRIHITWVLS